MTSKAERIASHIQKLLATLSRECIADLRSDDGHATPNPERLTCLDELHCLETSLRYMLNGFSAEERIESLWRVSTPSPRSASQKGWIK